MAQTIGEIVTKLTADIGDHQVKLKQAQDQIKRLQGSAQKAQGGFNKMSSSFARFAAGFVGVGVAIQATRVIMRNMVADTKALDRAMGQVETLTDKSSAAFDALTKQVQELSRAIPKSADDLGMGLYQTLSAGITDTADAMRVLEASAKLAASGLLDTQTSVDAVTTVMNAYGITADKVTDVTDAFFQTVKEGKITVGGLAASIGTAATSAALAGVSVDDLGAAISTMTKLGIDANTTTTSLNRLFLSIVDATDETREAAAALGIEWSTAALKAKGLAGFMREVAVATDGNVDALVKLGLEQRSARSLFILAGQGAAEFARIQESFTEKSGATQTAFDKTNARIEAQQQLVRNRLAVAWTEFGNKVLPLVIGKLLEATNTLEGATDRTVRLLRELGAEEDATAASAKNLDRELRRSLGTIRDELSKVGGIELSDIIGFGDPRGLSKRLRDALKIPTITFDVDVDVENVQQQMGRVLDQVSDLERQLSLDPDDVGLSETLRGLELHRDRLGDILILLDDYEKTQRDIAENSDVVLRNATGLSEAGIAALRPIAEIEASMEGIAAAASRAARERTGLGLVSVAMAAERDAMEAILIDARSFRAQMDRVGSDLSGLPKALNLSGLSFDQLREAQEQLSSAISSDTVALAFTRDQGAAEKLEAKLADAEQAARAVGAALAGMPVPQIDFSALSAAEFWDWYAQLQADLEANALELKLAIDGSEAQAEMERVRAELEAQQAAARASLLVPGAGLTGPVAMEGTTIRGAASKLTGDLEALGVVTRQIPNWWRTSFTQTDKVQETYRKGLVTVTRTADEYNDATKGVIGSLIDWGKANFNPSEFFSNFAANLATGFTSMAGGALMSGLSSLASGLFGEPAWQKEQRERIKENTEALNTLSASFRDQARVFASLNSAQFFGVQDILADAQRGDRFNIVKLRQGLEAYGLTVDDLRVVAEAMGLEWELTADVLKDVAEGLGDIDVAEIMARWEQSMSLMQREFSLLDIEDPMERFNRTIAQLSEHVGDDLAAQLAGLDASNIDAFIEDIFKRIRAGDEELFKQFGLLTMDDFLDALGMAEDALDELADDTNKFGDALRNVPSGFKVALRRFQADTGEMAKDAFSNLGPGTETKPRTDLEGSIPGEPIVMKAADSFASAVDMFSMTVADALNNELAPTLQEFMEAFVNPLTGMPLADVFANPLLTATTQGAPGAPPLGTGEGAATPGGGDSFVIHQLTVISNDPDDMLDKITSRAKQKARLGGVTDLDLAVRPIGTRGTPSGVR
jgi:TP901 family phage tail tape measure protein